MEPAISVTIDKAKMRALEKAVSGTRGRLPKIARRALKRTTTGAQTQIDKEVRNELALSQRAVKRRIVVEVATDWVWRLGISTSRVSVGSFRYRWSKRNGVSYTIRRGQSKRIPSGFVRNNPNAGDETPKAVFRRVQRGESGFGDGLASRTNPDVVRRYPLKFLRGPSIGQFLTDEPGILRRVEQTGRQRLEKELVGQMNFELQRRWPQ